MVPQFNSRICNVLVRIRIRNPNPDPQGFGSGSAWIRIYLSCWIRIRIKSMQIRNPADRDPEHCSFRYGTYRIVPILCIATGTLPPQFYYDDVLHWDDDLW